MANSRQRDVFLNFFDAFLCVVVRLQFLAGAFAAGAAAAAGAGGGAGLAGLIQQACTRPLRLSGAFGSMLLPCRTRQRKDAWI